MLIGIDASRSVSTIQKTGVEKVSDELIKEIEKLRNKEIKGNEIKIIFYTPKQISWLPQENQKILPWPFKFLWTQIRLAYELIFHSPNIMFFPVHSLPLVLLLFLPFTNYRLLVTSYYHIIHDIAFKKHPEFYSWSQRLILNLDLWLSLKLCTKIFVPTEAVKNDILSFCHSRESWNPVDKIIVTPWGYNKKNYKLQITDYELRKKQFLYIGRIEEKKNITNLIKAFKIFHATNPEYKLILAGKIDEEFKKNHNSLFTIHNSIQFLGYIPEEKKQELLSESIALIHVPFEEGFCFPMLEAFDFSLPVVASDIPVLREVGGDACLYVNPNSPEDIANAMNAFTETQNLASLQEKGRARLAIFSWEKTTEKILNKIIK
ncbi:MAG TPA: glycosyltransferase family 1 protein [bacterium]|nr:glycosyltransferase family 1 protein [bacterium]